MTAAMVNFILTIKTLVLDLEPENKTLGNKAKMSTGDEQDIELGVGEEKKRRQ